MLRSNIDVLFVTSFLCSLTFLLFHRIEYPKRCLWKKSMKFFYCPVFVIWLYLQKDLWPMKAISFYWIEYNPISIMYKFQIDISSDSREIKYQNIGRTHRQTDRQTYRFKTIPRNPLRGWGNERISKVVSLSTDRRRIRRQSLCSRVARRKPLGPNSRYAIKYDGTKLLVGMCDDPWEYLSFRATLYIIPPLCMGHFVYYPPIVYGPPCVAWSVAGAKTWSDVRAPQGRPQRPIK